MLVSKGARLLCWFVLTEGLQVPLCTDRARQGSLSLHRLVTFPKYPDTEQICRDFRFLSSWHNPYSDWVTCFSRGNLAHAVDTLHKSYYKNKANNSTHTNIELTFPSPLCSAAEKKAFHYINLSNGENIQEARWICSRLHSVLLSLVKRKTFLFHFPQLQQSSPHVLFLISTDTAGTCLFCPLHRTLLSNYICFWLDFSVFVKLPNIFKRHRFRQSLLTPLTGLDQTKWGMESVSDRFLNLMR